ncbi:MAG: TlpA disulfide reductase family protein [Candidatus Methylomirabilia bacterium]
MKKFVAGLVLTVFLCSLAPAMASVRDLNTVKVGDIIPAFKGRSLTGEEIDVGALIGKKVLVLSFWSIYCKPCVEEISSLIRLQEQVGGDNLAVIGINADSELGLARIRTFVGRFEEFEKRKINYSLIFDEGSAIGKLLGVGFLPTVLSVNLKGQVEKIFMGFEEKSEPEIFAGIRSLLPSETAGGEGAAEATIFAVESIVPLCGFYDNQGWKASFQESYDLPKELERIAEIARRKALKIAMRDALVSVGVSLLREPLGDVCLRPQGVWLPDDPFKVPDCLTNLLAALPVDKLTKVLESQEDFLGTEYRVAQRVSINLPDLKSELEKLKVQVPPRTVTFSVVNLRKMDLSRFERTLARQSRFIGLANFPTYTVYTSTETFAEEVKRMDFGGLKLFVEETDVNRIELEVWK